MHILFLELNHISAPVHFRERLIFSKKQIRVLLSCLSCGLLSGNMAGMVILSTCHRVEIYAVSAEEIFPEIETFLLEARGMARDEFTAHLYYCKDEDAARPRFNVAAELDSLAVGEPQPHRSHDLGLG